MKGKILKVFNNDLYSKEDEREVILFATFVHKKYSNKYAIFTFKEDTLPKKLYYGSVYLKEKAIVIFDVKQESIGIVKDFIEEYKKQEFKEFEIIDPSNLEKAELVNFNEMEFPDIDLIYSLAFPKEEIDNSETKKKKPTLLLIFLLLLIGGGIAFYFLSNRNEITKHLECNMQSYNNELNMNYDILKYITFNDKDIVDKVNVTETYKFLSYEEYTTFKNENKQYEYFTSKGTYKYVDESRELKIFYEEKEESKGHEQIISILERSGYTCKEVIDER